MRAQNPPNRARPRRHLGHDKGVDRELVARDAVQRTGSRYQVPRYFSRLPRHGHQKNIHTLALPFLFCSSEAWS